MYFCTILHYYVLRRFIYINHWIAFAKHQRKSRRRTTFRHNYQLDQGKVFHQILTNFHLLMKTNLISASIIFIFKDFHSSVQQTKLFRLSILSKLITLQRFCNIYSVREYFQETLNFSLGISSNHEISRRKTTSIILNLNKLKSLLFRKALLILFKRWYEFI